MDQGYVETVRLLLESAPAILESRLFAIKGGTAINLFIEEMPRLSVDIDLVYLNHQSTREEALQDISRALGTARRALERVGLESTIAATKDGEELKLFIRRNRAQVKVEVNQVFRGTILPVETRRLQATALQLFTTELSAPILAIPELYGGKVVAALDRQHPRDLFDVRSLFARGGLTPMVVECAVCYLAGHNRPIHEVLFSRDANIAAAYTNEFAGLTRTPVTLSELEDIRRRLKAELPAALTPNQRAFLLGLAAAEPDWGLMACPHVSEMPAIRWKIRNLVRLREANPRKFAQQAKELRTRLSG